MQKIKHSRFVREQWLILLGVGVFFFALGYLLPYTHDDWAWGSQIGIDRLNSLFENYNGRWMGNFSVLALTRSRLLRAAAYGVSMVVIFRYAGKLADNPPPIVRLWMIIVLLLMPSSLFAQSLGWTSGFANYTISVAVMLPLVDLVFRRISAREPKPVPAYQIILWMLLCFAGQLFIEHVTLYMLALMGFACIFRLARYKKLDIPLLCLGIAALGGAVLMFSNGAYANAFSPGENPYQQVEVAGGLAATLQTAWDTLQNVIIGHLYTNNIVLCAALGAASITLLRQIKPKRSPIFIIGILLAFSCQIALLAFSEPLADIRLILEPIALVLFLIGIIRAVWCVPNLRWRGLFTLGSAAVLTAPLMVVSPIGPRNFFVIYIFLLILFAQICKEIRFQEKKPIRKTLVFTSLALCGASMLFYIIGFFNVHLMDLQRIDMAHTQAEQGKTTLILPRLPMEDYMHCSTPVNEIFCDRFKLFYDLPPDLKLEFFVRS